MSYDAEGRKIEDIFEGITQRIVELPGDEIDIYGLFSPVVPSQANKPNVQSVQDRVALPTSDANMLGRSRFGTAQALDALDQSNALARGRQSLPSLLNNPAFTGLTLQQKLQEIRTKESQEANLLGAGLNAKTKSTQLLTNALDKTLAREFQNRQLKQQGELGSVNSLLKLQQAQAKPSSGLSNEDAIKLTKLIGEGSIDIESPEGALLHQQVTQRLLASLR